MPYDGVMIHTIACQLREDLRGTRIERILQPERDELQFSMRAAGKKFRLVLSCNAQFARTYLCKETIPQNDHPPMFCMLLRKHLSGGRFLDVRQKGLDRVLYFDFSARDELGDEAVWTLAVEMMGKHSNLILVDQNGIVVDAIKRVYPEKSRVRPVLPAMAYVAPPGKVKRDPLQMDAEAFLDMVQTLPDAADRQQQLMEVLEGVSPGTAREILTQAGLYVAGPVVFSPASNRALAQALNHFFSRIRQNDVAPVVCMDEAGVPRDVQPFAYASTSQWRSQLYPTPSDAAEAFFSGRTHALRVSQKSADLAHLLKTRVERAEKKLALQQTELLEAENAEALRLRGELLSAYLYLVPKGASSVSVPDYTREGQPQIQIALSPALSPAQNVQEYFRRYSRAKSAQKQLAQHIAESTEELQVLSQHAYNLSQCRNEAEIDEVRREMIDSGVLHRQVQKNKSKSPKREHSDAFDTYTTSSGLQVQAGRNNRQNDILTKNAAPLDVWLHVQKRPGSHVIVRTQGAQIDDASLIEAAQIAAAYSSGRTDGRVAVDYTLRKYVKKPGGAPAGFVTYTHQQTLYVEPMKRQ